MTITLSGILSFILTLLISLISGFSQVHGMVVFGESDTTGTSRDVIDPSGKLLIRINPDLTKTYYVYGLGLLYEANQADATKTYHFDQVGSTLLRTDDLGKVIGRAEYSAYGIMFWKQGDMATPFLYNGRAGVQTDSNGLLNMLARYYSPYLMRFLNADPIGFSGGSNWFAYADGNPISLSDPFGLCAESQSAYILRTVGPEPVGFWNNLKGALTGDMHAREAAAAEWNTANNKQDGFASFQKGMAVGADVSGIATAGLIGIKAANGTVSTGRTAAMDLKEQLAMEQVVAKPMGTTSPRMPAMSDTKNGLMAADGWVKRTQRVNGVEIHYVENTKTGQVIDFKFKD